MTEEHHNPLQHGVVRDIGGRGSWVPRGLEELRELVSQEGEDGGEEVTGAVSVLGHGRQLQQSSGENIHCIIHIQCMSKCNDFTSYVRPPPPPPPPSWKLYNVSLSNHKFPTTCSFPR